MKTKRKRFYELLWNKNEVQTCTFFDVFLSFHKNVNFGLSNKNYLTVLFDTWIFSPSLDNIGILIIFSLKMNDKKIIKENTFFTTEQYFI